MDPSADQEKSDESALVCYADVGRSQVAQAYVAILSKHESIIIDAGHTGRFFAVCDPLATLKPRKLGSFLPCRARSDRLHIGAHIRELREAETRLFCDVKYRSIERNRPV